LFLALKNCLLSEEPTFSQNDLKCTKITFIKRGSAVGVFALVI